MGNIKAKDKTSSFKVCDFGAERHPVLWDIFQMSHKTTPCYLHVANITIVTEITIVICYTRYNC